MRDGAQATLFKAMLDHGVYMEGAVLKSNVVNPGRSCATPYTAAQIGQANLDVFRRCDSPPPSPSLAPRVLTCALCRYTYTWEGEG